MYNLLGKCWTLTSFFGIILAGSELARFWGGVHSAKGFLKVPVDSIVSRTKLLKKKQWVCVQRDRRSLTLRENLKNELSSCSCDTWRKHWTGVGQWNECRVWQTIDTTFDQDMRDEVNYHSSQLHLYFDCSQQLMMVSRYIFLLHLTN